MLLESRTAVEEVTSLAAIASEWRELWERCPDATPFQSPEWQIAWWNAFGGEKELWALALRDTETERLVALLSACILPNECKVVFIGAALSDELDVLAESAFREEATSLFIDHLYADRHRWSVCDFEPLPPASPLARGATIHNVTPVLDPRAPLPTKLRHNIKWRTNRAEKLGQIEFESASEANLDDSLGALIALHAARWEQRGQRGVLCDTAVQQFHREASRGLLRRGMLRLYSLRLAGRIVASFYGFLHRGRMFYYLGGFDPELDKLSLGTLMIAHAIGEARREGAHEFNFLRGAEPYKYLWGAKDRYVYTRRLIA